MEKTTERFGWIKLYPNQPPTLIAIWEKWWFSKVYTGFGTGIPVVIESSHHRVRQIGSIGIEYMPLDSEDICRL